jgi:hypothetical protein
VQEEITKAKKIITILKTCSRRVPLMAAGAHRQDMYMFFI